MTRIDPLREALARLAEETRAAEEHLERLTADGASLAEQLAAASSVSHTRRVYVDAARGSRDGRAEVLRRSADDEGARTFAAALAELPEPSSNDPNPGSDDPLAALFR